MGLLIQNGDTIGGISSELVDKIGKVVQTPSNSNDEFYELLFSKTADNTERTEETRKCSSLQFNPNQSAITIGSRTPNSNIGTYSVAMGILCTASGAYSHAESVQTTASGDYSHSEGLYTTASGVHSHSEGFNTTASGQGSHAEGYSTIANHRSQHVFGEYNIEDPSQKYDDEQGNYIEIVGNGTTNIMRSNARTLDWNGNEMLAGSLSLAGTSSDISLSGSGNTWDGTNTSLKSAITDNWKNVKGYTGTSKSTADTGNWVAMCNSGSTGSPTLPTSNAWWHVLSLDCWKGAPNSWVSQLAIATQNNNGVWWRRNNEGGTSINSATWHRLAEGNAEGYANRAIGDGDGNTISSTYLKLSGGTLTGALNTANNTWNKIGDDVQIGDRNVSGGLGIQGLNGNTNIRFYKYGDASSYGNLQFDGGSFYFDKQLIISENNFQLRKTGVEVGTTSNNNVSAYQETNFYNTDKNNYWFTRVCSNAETNGNLSLHLQSRNMKTDGTVVQNNLQLGVKKDGTRIVAITDAGVWRSALGLGSIATKNTGDYLPISGGNLTGNTYVKKASGESDLGATNTASGKNIYLYAADSGNVGIYSNIGTNLIYMDTNKKVTIGGTTYGINNPANFRSALGLGSMATQNTSRLILWKMNSRTNVTQTATDDYWTVGQFPAKSGYTRYVMQIQLNNRAMVASYYTLESNNDIRVYTRMLSGTSQTFSIDVICVYLPDANKTS